MSNLPDGQQPLLLHISAAAEALGLTIAQVRGLCDEGLLPATTIKRKTYIPAASVGDYVRGIRAAS